MLNQKTTLKKPFFPTPSFVFAIFAFFIISCASHKFGNLFAEQSGVKISPDGETLAVKINGELSTKYNFTNVSRPFLYPIYGPHHLGMTRNWPMKETPDEERDHPHHRSLWFAHGDINGIDFWSEQPNAGRTVHEKFLEVRSGKNEGVIKTSNKLVLKDGKIIATDTREIRFYNSTNQMIDYEITIHASHGDLILGDTKEGSMAVRVAETMRLTKNGKPAAGHIVMSTGVRDGETWGKRAAWCDYTDRWKIKF